MKKRIGPIVCFVIGVLCILAASGCGQDRAPAQAQMEIVVVAQRAAGCAGGIIIGEAGDFFNVELPDGRVIAVLKTDCENGGI